MAHDPHRYLTGEERVLLDVRRHPIVLVAPLLRSAAVVVVLAVIAAVLDRAPGLLWNLVFLIAVFYLVWKALEWYVDRVVVTDQRIFEVSGLLTRSVASMPLTRVTDMTYRRSFFGRMFGYGDLIVESAGADQALRTIQRIAEPDRFYGTITELVIESVGIPAQEDGTVFNGRFV